MRFRSIAAVVSVAALGLPATALADNGSSARSSGTGQAQISKQVAATLQAALSQATAAQNAVNANVPVSIGGGHVSGGANSATQNANNGAASVASNGSNTNQENRQSQSGGGSSCGCGRSGQAQVSSQRALNGQLGASEANAHQRAVNANVPVSIGGGAVSGGANSANQNATNAAASEAQNDSNTSQKNNQTQFGGGSSCWLGCGGNGQAQLSSQWALTGQLATSEANAHRRAVNANVPVSIGGGAVSGGANSANQNATNAAASQASNDARTNQGGDQRQG